jgi:hypothetical protein
MTTNTNAHTFSSKIVVESTNRRVSGLTFGEALAIREAVRMADGAAASEGGGDMRNAKSPYGVRLQLLGIALWASSVGLAVMQALLFAALWVIQVLAPRALQLAEWTGGAVAERDLVMEETSQPREAAEPARPPARPATAEPAPTVVDGAVIRVRFEDREQVSPRGPTVRPKRARG